MLASILSLQVVNQSKTPQTPGLTPDNPYSCLLQEGFLNDSFDWSGEQLGDEESEDEHSAYNTSGIHNTFVLGKRYVPTTFMLDTNKEFLLQTRISKITLS